MEKKEFDRCLWVSDEYLDEGFVVVKEMLENEEVELYVFQVDPIKNTLETEFINDRRVGLWYSNYAIIEEWKVPKEELVHLPEWKFLEKELETLKDLCIKNILKEMETWD